MHDDRSPLTLNDPLAMSADMDRDQALDLALHAAKYQVVVLLVKPWLWALAAITPTACLSVLSTNDDPATWAQSAAAVALSALLLGIGLQKFMLRADDLLRNVYMGELIPRLIDTGYSGPVDSLTFDSFSKSDLRRVRSLWRSAGMTAVRARCSRKACVVGSITVVACTAATVLAAMHAVAGQSIVLVSLPATVLTFVLATLAVFVLYSRFVHAVSTLAGQAREDSYVIARSDQP